MTIDDNVFTRRFVLPESDDELAERVRIRVVPVTTLSSMGVSQALHTLDRVLKAIVVPDAQMLSELRRLAATAIAYSEIAYPDKLTFLQRTYSDAISEAVMVATCISGLAGTGKSVLLATMTRLSNEELVIEAPGHSRFKTTGCWHVRTQANIGLLKMLEPHFLSEENRGSRDVLAIACREANRQALALQLVDEFQFITQSEANVLAAKRLMQLSRLGPPLGFAANISLVRRLMKRPQEERDRLLFNPIYLHPLSEGSPDWQALVIESLASAPEFSQLDVTEAAALLASYTFGIKRSLANLLCISYSEMREARASKVTLDHIRAAYRSSAYAMSRTDVEILIAGHINPAKFGTRQDLQCPWEEIGVKRPATSNVLPHPAAEEHSLRQGQAAVKASMTAEERAAYELACGGATPVQPSKPTRPREPRAPATAQALLEGFADFTKQVPRGGSEN